MNHSRIILSRFYNPMLMPVPREKKLFADPKAQTSSISKVAREAIYLPREDKFTPLRKDQHLNKWHGQSYIILLNAVKTRPDRTTLSGLLLPIQKQNWSSVFPKHTVGHSCNVFGKFWNPVSALLWTQKAMSKLALRALNDLESPKTELKQKCSTFSLPAHAQMKIYPKIYPEEHWTSEQFVTLRFHLSYTSRPRDCPELHHLPGVPTGTSLNTAFCKLREVSDLASLDPSTQITGFRSKHSLVTFSLNLNWIIIVKEEQGSTK